MPNRNCEPAADHPETSQQLFSRLPYANGLQVSAVITCTAHGWNPRLLLILSMVVDIGGLAVQRRKQNNLAMTVYLSELQFG